MTKQTQSQIISKAQAQSFGLKYFFTGIPCKHGHLSERYMNKPWRCVQCCYLENRSRKSNKQKISINNKKFRYKNRDRLNQLTKIWRINNPDKVKQWRKDNADYVRIKNREWSARNPQKVLEQRRASYKRNSEKAKITVNKWIAKNKDLVRLYQRNNRAKRKNSIGKHISKEVRHLLQKQKFLCANCQNKISTDPKNNEVKAHLDHRIAITNGGTNFIDNLQWLCCTCNLRKGALDPIIWAQKEGRLL